MPTLLLALSIPPGPAPVLIQDATGLGAAGLALLGGPKEEDWTAE
jgi:hypothetical protein